MKTLYAESCKCSKDILIMKFIDLIKLVDFDPIVGNLVSVSKIFTIYLLLLYFIRRTAFF